MALKSLLLCFFVSHSLCSPTPSQQGSQMEAIWKADVASSSYPIEKKTPTNLPWEQLGGYPDIPRLLAADEHLSFPRSSMFFKAR